MASKQDLEWTFGLRNHQGKYLTAETFAHKLVCAASNMKKKQIFTLEEGQGETVFIRSHLGKYLAVDIDGAFTAHHDEAGVDCGFIIQAQPNGQWAIASAEHGFYLGGSGENLRAFVKEISGDRLWTVNLAHHPMVTIKNIKRTTFVHLADDGQKLTCDEVIPWGDDAVLSLIFNENGTYSVQAPNGAFLSRTGALHQDNSSSETHFVLEIHGGKVTFKSVDDNMYLTALGAQGLLKATKRCQSVEQISDNEKFELQNSYPQITLQAANGKFVSTKQGVELAAKEASSDTDKEIFQMEPLGGDQFRLKIHNSNYVRAGASAEHSAEDGVHASDSDVSSDQTTYTVEFVGEAGVNSIAFKASNGKYLQQQMNGYLKAKADEASADAKSTFVFSIVNRPRIAFRSSIGFLQTMGSGLIEVNKSTPDVYMLESKGGRFAVLAENGKYWTVGENGNTSATGDSAQYFYVELKQNSKLAIRTESGKYLKIDAGGGFLVANGGDGESADTQFEY
jgi:fascin 1/2